MKTDIKVKVTVYKQEQWDTDWPPTKVFQFAEWFNEKINQIPLEHRDSAQIEIKSEHDYDTARANIVIFYHRDLTADEIARQEKNEEERKAAIRNGELQELKRLTDKYGET